MVKTSVWNARDPGSISWSGRSPGEGNSNPFQYFCMENSKDRKAWRALVMSCKESDTTDWLILSWYTYPGKLKNCKAITTVRILFCIKKLLISSYYPIQKVIWPSQIYAKHQFFARNVPFQAVQSQHNCFCYQGVVRWFSQHWIVYSALS